VLASDAAEAAASMTKALSLGALFLLGGFLDRLLGLGLGLFRRQPVGLDLVDGLLGQAQGPQLGRLGGDGGALLLDLLLDGDVALLGRREVVLRPLARRVAGIGGAGHDLGLSFV